MSNRTRRYVKHLLFQHSLKCHFIAVPHFSLLPLNLLNLHKLCYIFDCLNQSCYLKLSPTLHFQIQIQKPNGSSYSCYLNSDGRPKEFEVSSVVSKCVGESVSDEKQDLLSYLKSVNWGGTLRCFMHLSRQGQLKQNMACFVLVCVCTCVCVC